MELIASNQHHSLQIQMPALIASLSGTLSASAPPDTENPITLRLDSPCFLRVAIKWELQLNGEPIESGRFIPGSPEVQLVLPSLEPGSHLLEARASWSDTEVSSWTQTLLIEP